MAIVSLVHPDVTHRITVDLLVTKCRRFIANQELTRELYRVQAAVAADVFRAFVAALEGNAVDITEGNYADLSQLCEEFGFDGLTGQLSLFQPSVALKDAEARRRISALEERWQQSDRQIAELQPELCRQTETQERAMAALEAEVAQLKAAAGGMAAQAALPARVDRAEVEIARVATEADIARVTAEVALLKEVAGGTAARVDRSEADIARVAAEAPAVGQMRADMARIVPKATALVVAVGPLWPQIARLDAEIGQRRADMARLPTEIAVVRETWANLERVRTEGAALK
jgi:hypothetical protein